MCAIEGGLGAISCASGMAAITAVALGLCEQGDQIVSANSIFGGTYSLFTGTLKRFGIDAELVETTNPEAYRQAITDRTKMIFVETVGNPKLDVPDIAAIAAIAREHGVAMVVDNTFTSPALIRPREFGADIVVYSTSKSINGHGNAIGGILIDSGTFDWSGPRYDHLHELHNQLGRFAFLAFLRTRVYRDLGLCFSPFNAFLMSIGIESLGVRMERHCRNAAAVASHLAAHKEVTSVRYPGLPDHPDHETATRQFAGLYGALLTVRLGSRERSLAFINGLKRAQILANLGDTRTLVIHPASTFCREFTEDQQASMGVTDDLVRLSIGLEHGDDLIADMDQSLSQL